MAKFENDVKISDVRRREVGSRSEAGSIACLGLISGLWRFSGENWQSHSSPSINYQRTCGFSCEWLPNLIYFNTFIRVSLSRFSVPSTCSFSARMLKCSRPHPTSFFQHLDVFTKLSLHVFPSILYHPESLSGSSALQHSDSARRTYN